MAVDTLARAIAAGKTPVTAYEEAVKAGYTGTEEQFAQDMGNSGTNAANAAASASAASASAESVSASATQIATNTSDINELKTQLTVLGDEVTAIGSGMDMEFYGWEQGTVYKAGSSDKMVLGISTTRCRIVPGKMYPQINSVSCESGYQCIAYACSFDGTDYHYITQINSNWASEVDVSEYSQTNYILFSARKVNDENILPSEAEANINYTIKINNEIRTIKANILSIFGDINAITDTLSKILMVEINPSSVQNSCAYYSANDSVVSVTHGKLKKFAIESGTDYYVTTSFTGTNTGFPLIAYFDSNDEYISYEYMNIAGEETAINNAKLRIPNTASWFYVNSRDTESIVRVIEEPTMSVPEIIEHIENDFVSILFVGNSLTQDGIAYLPYLLKTFYPGINFRLYMWYNGGYTLAQQYQKFVNDQACDIFSVAENTPSWTNSSQKMSHVLATYKFDMVCMQEYFNYKESYSESDLTDWNNCRDYISANYTGGNGLEFISLIHAPLRSDADNVFTLTMSGNALILQKTIAEDAIPNGIAVYRALSTALDSLGDQGHLSPDGTHTQEGLPCLLQTYTTLLWLFDKLSINKSVYGIPFKMTTAIYNTINVPGPNLGTGVIEGTNAQNLLAQEVAIKAYKEGKQFVIENLYSAT